MNVRALRRAIERAFVGEDRGRVIPLVVFLFRLPPPLSRRRPWKKLVAARKSRGWPLRDTQPVSLYQGFLQLRDDRLHRLESRIPFVVCRDKIPRRIFAGSLLEHLVRRLVVLVPFLAVAPVFIADFPMLQRIGFAAFEAPELLVLGDVKVELDKDRAVVRQQSLELVDLAISALPFRIRSEALDRSTSTRPYQERSQTASCP